MTDAGRDDAAFVSALREAAKDSWGWGEPYRIAAVTVQNHQVDIDINDGTDSVRVWVALPSSLRPMPWMVFSDPDPRGWVSQLADWLNEEMDTVGLGPHVAVHTDGDGHRRVVVAGYGFKLSDGAEHRRLQAAVGPRGWTEDRSEDGRWRIRRAYALEWALDEAERFVGDEGSSGYYQKAAILSRWSLVSPDALAIAVEGAADEDNEMVLTATTRSLWRRHSSHRRVMGSDKRLWSVERVPKSS